MRRALSILLVLFYALGPLTATREASDDARLPACCRRHGAHHCAMADAAVARITQAASGAAPVLTAPSHCPLFPNGDTATVAPVHALTAACADSPAQFARRHSPLTYSLSARAGQIRPRASRDPPDLL